MYSYIVTNQQSADLDRNAHSKMAIMPLALMEEAASGLFYRLKEDFPDLAEKKIALAAGWGNNGGDVLSLARRLYFAGIKPDLYIFEDKTGSQLYKSQLATIKTLDIPLFNITGNYDFTGYDLIIEGIFGIGYQYRENKSIEKVFNTINNSPALIISVDIPSGLTRENTLSIRADYTYSIGFYKELFYTLNTRRKAGTISNITISFDILTLDNPGKNRLLVSIPPLENRADNFGHKYSKGAALCIGGSPGKFGSILFSAESALNTGAGIVQVISDEKNIVPLNSMSGRVVVDSYQNLEKELQKYGAALIGPGLAAGEPENRKIIKKLCSKEHLSFVLDASFFSRFSCKDLALFKKPPILTPHLKEFTAFFGLNPEDVKRNTLETVARTAADYNCYIVLKDCFITIGLPDSSVLVFDHPDAIASQAGSGDILAGIICGLLSQGIAGEEAIKEGIRIFYSIVELYRKKQVKAYIHEDFIKHICEI